MCIRVLRLVVVTCVLTLTLNLTPWNDSSPNGAPLVPIRPLSSGIAQTIKREVMPEIPIAKSGTSATLSPIISGTGTIMAAGGPASGAITSTTGPAAAQAPLLSISMTASPNPLTPGQVLKYTIVYTNVGDAPAQNVIVTETYPSNINVTFSDAFPTPDAGTNNVWSVGLLAPNDSGSIVVFMNTPSQMPVGTVLTNSVSISADGVASAFYTTTTTVNALPVLSVSVIDSPNPVRPGQDLHYVITYRNAGSAPVSNVRITDTYPAQVAFGSSSLTPSLGINNVFWVIDTLNANDVGTIDMRVTVKVPMTDTTILANRVVVSAQEAAPYTTTQQTLVTAPRLRLDSYALPATPTPNSQLTYTFLYSNTGSSYATTPVITTIVPANTSFVQCQPQSIGCSVNGNGTLVTWQLPQNLEQQTTGAVTLTVLVKNNLANGTVVANTAGIYAAFEKVGDTAQLNTTLTSAPNVILSKSDSLTTIAAGDFTTYTLSYANVGTAPANNVVITDRLPANTTFNACTTPCPTSGGVYTFTLGTVDANTNGSRTFSVRAANPLPAGLRAITNTAGISTITGGDVKGDNLAQDVDSVSTQPDLALGVIYDARTPYPGKVITYTIRYTNTSAMDTTGVQITTTRPAWLSAAAPGWLANDTIDVMTIGNLAAGQSSSVNYVVTLPQAYTLDMNAFTQTFFIQDDGPGGWPPAQAQYTTVIGVPDLVVDHVSVPPEVKPGTSFPVTVTIRNLGLGRACNPSNCGGFYIDTFVSPATPPPSYPFVSESIPSVAVSAINAGQAVTIVVQNVQLRTDQKPLLYFKVDNYACPGSSCLPIHSLGGLVPEYNEYNNVFGPVFLVNFKLYLPLIRKP